MTTREELREKVAREMCKIEFDEAPFDMEDWWPTFKPMADAAIRVSLEAAIDTADGPYGKYAMAICALMPEELNETISNAK